MIDLLEAHDIRIERAQHLDRAIERIAPVGADALVDVPGDDAQGRGHGPPQEYVNRTNA